MSGVDSPSMTMQADNEWGMFCTEVQFVYDSIPDHQQRSLSTPPKMKHCNILQIKFVPILANAKCLRLTGKRTRAGGWSPTCGCLQAVGQKLLQL